MAVDPSLLQAGRWVEHFESPGGDPPVGPRYGTLQEQANMAREVLALSAELRAHELIAYADALPDGVTTEAFAEAAILRREAARLRG